MMFNSVLRNAATLLMLCFIAFALPGCKRDQQAQTSPTPTTEPTPREPFDAHLSLVNNGGHIDFNGIVDSKASQDAIQSALRASYGEGRLSGEVAIDDVARVPSWTTGLTELLTVFGPASGAALRFEADRIVLSGMVDAETRAKLRAAAAAAFPEAKLEGLFVGAGEPAAASAIVQQAADPAKLTQSLNQMPVKFETGSGNVSADSLALVAQAADAIRAAPAGTRLLIVGPVAPTNDAANDVFLSKQRAEALKVQLILNGVNPAVIDTRGWGQNPDGSRIEGMTPPPEGAAMRFELVR